MKRKWKILLGALVVVFIVGFTWYEMTKGLEAEVLEVHRGTIAKTFQEDGKVVSEVERPIYAVYGGKIVDILVKEGQGVKKGELLVVLDSTELEYQLEQSRAQLKSLEGEQVKTYQEPYESRLRAQQLQVEQAQRDLETAKTNLLRIKELYDAGAVSTQEYEAAQKMVETAENHLEQQKEALALLYESHGPTSGTNRYYEGRIEALKAQISSLEYKLSKSRIVAPIDGTVSGLDIKEGQVVSPSQLMMTVFKPGSYQVEVYVLTEDVAEIELGMKVKLVQDREDEDIVFEGTVENIAPSAVKTISPLGLEEQRVKVTIRPAVPEGLQLFPGYELEVEFTTAKRENELVVPKTTLFPYENGDALWVVRSGRAKIQPVKTGFENDRDVTIVEGLQEGDLVIVNPQLQGLAEGKKIIVK